MKHEIINRIIQQVNAESYLEIGVQHCVNFDKIKCAVKLGVDPNYNGPYRKDVCTLGSSGFFALSDYEYDVIFIDGLHESWQVIEDIQNAWKCNPKAIILHDTVLQTQIMQEVPRKQQVWTGDVWRAVVGFLFANPDVKHETYRADWGLTIIYPEGEFNEFDRVDMPYEYFKMNEDQILNIID